MRKVFIRERAFIRGNTVLEKSYLIQIFRVIASNQEVDVAAHNFELCLAKQRSNHIHHFVAGQKLASTDNTK